MDILSEIKTTFSGFYSAVLSRNEALHNSRQPHITQCYLNIKYLQSSDLVTPRKHAQRSALCRPGSDGKHHPAKNHTGCEA